MKRNETNCIEYNFEIVRQKTEARCWWNITNFRIICMNASCCSISRHIRTYKWYIFTKNVDRRQPKKKSTEQQNDKKSNNNNRKPMKKNSKITNKNAFSARYSPNDSLTLCATFAHHRATWHEIQRRNHFRSMNTANQTMYEEKKNVIAKCDHASTSPKQFRKSYKMVTLNYGRFRFGYRNSSIRRLNSQIHAIYAGKRITKNVPFDVWLGLFARSLFFFPCGQKISVELGKHCDAIGSTSSKNLQIKVTY